MSQLENGIDLGTHGYRREMPQRFSVFSLIALSFSLTGSWATLGSSMGIAIKEGSAAGTVWSPLIGATMTAILSLGMAELASAYPVASGQYYWAFRVSSKEYRNLASYVNGWINIIAYWLSGASLCNFTSSLILSIVFLWYPEYQSKSWHQWLVYVGVIWLGVALNSFGAQILPTYIRFHFMISCLTLTGTVITLLVCRRHNHAPAKWTFGDTTNRTGWSNDGFAFLLVISNSVYSFLGTDSGVHMCEELPEPAKNVPKVVMYPLLFGLLTAFPFTCACMNAITDVETVLDTPSGLPLIEIYYQSTGSKEASSVLLALLVFCFFGCWVSTATASSRIVWSICRDDALPFSNVWAYIHPWFKIPLNALCLSAVFISLYGLIFLGSTTAFSAMIGAAVIFMQLCCALPQMILLYRGRDKILPDRPFSLGRLGSTVNAITTLWTIFLIIIYFFPTERPVTKENMNYVVVVTVGFIGIVFALYVPKRNTFKGPRIPTEYAPEMVEVHPVK